MEVREGDGWEDTRIRAWRTGADESGAGWDPGSKPQPIGTGFVPVCCGASGSQTHPSHRKLIGAGQSLTDTALAHPLAQ